MILKVKYFSFELKRPICFSTLFLAFIISSSNIYRNASLFLYNRLLSFFSSCSKSFIRPLKSYPSMFTSADLHRFVHIFILSSINAVRIFFFYSTLSERTLSRLVSSAFFTAVRSLNPLSAESRDPIAVTAPATTPVMPEEDSACPPLTDNKAV